MGRRNPREESGPKEKGGEKEIEAKKNRRKKESCGEEGGRKGSKTEVRRVLGAPSRRGGERVGRQWSDTSWREISFSLAVAGGGAVLLKSVWIPDVRGSAEPARTVVYSFSNPASAI